MKWLLLAVAALVGLVVLAVLVLFLLGFRGDAGRVEHAVEIARPPAAVWPWVVEPERQKQWVGWLTEIHERESGPPAPGHRMTWVMIDPNMGNQRVEIHGEYAEVQPERLSVVKLDAPGMFTGTATYELTALGDGRSRLSYVSEYEMGSWFHRLLEPVVTPQARKKAVEDVERLKTLAEAEGAAATAVGTGAG